MSNPSLSNLQILDTQWTADTSLLTADNTSGQSEVTQKITYWTADIIAVTADNTFSQADIKDNIIYWTADTSLLTVDTNSA